MRALWLPLALGVPLSAIVLVIAAWGASTTQRVAIEALILVIAVVGLYVFSGTSGVLQFGHIAFVAAGAYVSAHLTIPPGIKRTLFPDFPGFLSWMLDLEVAFLPATLISGLVAAALALVFSFPLMRLGGVQAAIATFAVLIIMQGFLVQTVSLTRGTSAVYGIPGNTTTWAALLWALLAIAVASLYQHSRRGLMLQAAREDERAARSSGVRVAQERGVAFILSAFFLGIAGSLYAQFLTTISPAAFYVELTFLTVMMLVVGGSRSLTGAVVGVVFIAVVREALRRVEIGGLGPIPGGVAPGLTEVILAAILIATLIARPNGLTANREIRLPAFIWRAVPARATRSR